MAMMFEEIRIFKSQGGLSDLSLANQDDSQTLALDLTTSDYLYVAQRLPFNNLFLNVSTANATAATWTIEYWDGNEWEPAVDQLDATSSGGATLAQTGNIRFTVDRDQNWNDVIDTSLTSGPTELQSIELYNYYWMRMQPSANLDAGTLLGELTYAFTEDQELEKFDIEIDKYLTGFAPGKTSWTDEIITASKMVVLDLRRQGLVVSPGQIIQFDDVFIAATMKTLDLIYGHLGPSYRERRKDIQAEYSKALDLRRFTLDTNADGEIDRNEISGQIKRMVR